MAAKGTRSRLGSNTGDEGKARKRSTSGTGKEEVKCPDCSKVVSESDAGIQCEVCEDWFHPKCQKITDDVYSQNAGVHWYCNGCNKGVAKLFQAVAKLQARQDKLEDKVATVSNEVMEMKDDIRQVKDDVNEKIDVLEGKFESMRTDQVTKNN